MVEPTTRPAPFVITFKRPGWFHSADYVAVLQMSIGWYIVEKGL